jgi:hypothetical protein
MFRFSAWRKRNEIKQLNKDAPLIIEYARQTKRPESVLEIARLTSQHLDHAHKAFGTTPIGLNQAIDEYKRLHKQAHRQRDDLFLSALTLVLIYIRSEAMGQDCRPAIKTINTFLG